MVPFLWDQRVTKGIILRTTGGAYDVDTADGVKAAVLRGRLKLEERLGDRVVAGDRVELAPPERPDEAWTIEHVEERTSSLARRAPGKAPRAKVIAANVDRVLIVFAAADPEPHLRMLDRFLVLCEASDVDPIIVVNKVDLVGLEAARSIFDLYETIGYPVIYTSVSEGEGVERVRDAVCSGISALTGPSGVGKSSLLNRIEPGLRLRVGTIGELVRKGRHTTVTAELIRLRCGGYVADTPGLRELGLWGIEPSELQLYFPEFAPFSRACRYGNSCTHSHEPGCDVARAAMAGEIPASRFESYHRLLAGEEDSEH